MHRRLIPQIVTTIRGYSRDDFAADLGAGIIVGIVALPLAIAFGIASGVSPQQGMYTAIVAGFIISVLGGSTVQIGGPTGAFVVIVYGIMQKYGYSGLAVATLMAGVILIAMGVAGLGGAIKFIPYPVTTGFTAGIALLIASRPGEGRPWPAHGRGARRVRRQVAVVFRAHADRELGDGGHCRGGDGYHRLLAARGTVARERILTPPAGVPAISRKDEG